MYAKVSQRASWGRWHEEHLRYEKSHVLINKFQLFASKCLFHNLADTMHTFNYSIKKICECFRNALT